MPSAWPRPCRSSTRLRRHRRLFPRRLRRPAFCPRSRQGSILAAACGLVARWRGRLAGPLVADPARRQKTPSRRGLRKRTRGTVQLELVRLSISNFWGGGFVRPWSWFSSNSHPGPGVTSYPPLLAGSARSNLLRDYSPLQTSTRTHTHTGIHQCSRCPPSLSWTLLGGGLKPPLPSHPPSLWLPSFDRPSRHSIAPSFLFPAKFAVLQLSRGDRRGESPLDKRF